MIKLSLKWRLTILITVLIIFTGIVQAWINNYYSDKQLSTAVKVVRSRIINISPINGIDNSTIESLKELDEKIQIRKYISLVGILLFSSAITYSLVAYCLKPLKQLTEHIREVDEHNLSNSPQFISSADEISHLTKSFHQMTNKLSQAFITQQRFSADVAHELRTPLAVMKTKLEVFSMQEHTKKEYEALFKTVSQQTTRLSKLTNQLLELNCPYSEIEKEAIQISSIIDEVQCDLEDIAAPKQVQLDSYKGSDFVIVENYQAIYRILFNLIENGIKYNKPGGRVTVSCGQNQYAWYLEVSDTGLGIPQIEQECIFKPFVRVDKSRSRKFGGAGLGLAIVKNIVDLYGGNIRIGQNTPCGSIFHIEFPLN